MTEKLIIRKKDPVKGDDGYRIFSVRLQNATVNRLEAISAETNRSRNGVINALLDFALSHCEVQEDDDS